MPKRETAYKVRISDIHNGKYIINEGWEPNFIDVDGFKFSRVNVLGTVVGFEDNMMKIDDGTGEIFLRSFEDGDVDINSFKIGKVVLVIGRPREFNDTRFIVPEIISEINNPEWIKVRQIELKKVPEAKKNKPVEEEKVKVEEIEKKPENIAGKLVDYIKDNDNGNGIPTEQIIKMFGSDAENKINRLLQEGEIFEIKPGVVKIL